MNVTPESVRELLHSETMGDRLRGVNQLRQLEPAIALELILPTIQDSSARVRYAAVSQMASLGQLDRDVALTVLRDRLLNDSETDVQAAAADSLGGLQLTEAFEELQEIYHNTSEWLLKLSIVAALGELGDSRSFTLLEDALNSSESLIKTAAIGSFGELGDQRATALLIPYASDADWQIRHRVAQALGRLGGPEVRPILETLAQDEVTPVAQTAQVSLSAVV
ncbi:HEAT repeat domain-containing protein [Laspinema sp. A4]|uniref:phycobilisome degradation protein NblB n=1 Tax=Laspinema sp. D2d TaxID=2953686 RepID=UPI0021BA7D5B|nr:HEAT repeat domain-containing protein [Laspinema sp. D2d]MCT7983587.1 HEAT repeat domain-containing protein [Laspinema sp. D2d]